jgi:hypothetical protein
MTDKFSVIMLDARLFYFTRAVTMRQLLELAIFKGAKCMKGIKKRKQWCKGWRYKTKYFRLNFEKTFALI